MPRWHCAQVSAMLARFTLERGSALGSSWCGGWQLAHRAGTFREYVGEAESSLPRVPCGLWQSRQRGASGLPWAANVPCLLSRYWPTTFSWQMEQSTLLAMVLQALTL